MATKSKEPKKEGSLPLSQVLSALQHEFTRAAAGHDATMSAWKEIYATATIFEAKTPTGLKLVTAQVALPVVIHEVVTAPVVAGRLTMQKLTEALSPKLEKGARQQLALAVCRELAAKGQDRLDDAKLAAHVHATAKKLFPKLPLQKVELTHSVTALQQERKRQATAQPEAKVFYRADDLASLPPERVMVMNLEFRLE